MKSKKEKSKVKKEKKERKSTSLMENLRSQADLKNELDCSSILDDLNTAASEGEYKRTVEIKVNQAHYLKTLGVSVKGVEGKNGFYEVSWQYESVMPQLGTY